MSAYEHRAVTSNWLMSPEQLDVEGYDGWELLQAIPYSEGMNEIGPGQILYYFRRSVEAA